jgi:SNF2 family DNA or RNA helicase
MISIHSDTNRKDFLLKGNINQILDNRRLLITMKRLGYKVLGEEIAIPYEEATKIHSLKGIQQALERFSLPYELSLEVQEDVSSYVRELDEFSTFSEYAKKIRNNEFDNNLALVEEFKNFQEILKTTLVRRLYPLQLLSAFHLAFAQNACNFAVPGAGKTSIVYGAYSYLKSLPSENPKHVDKILVVGPLSSFAPWENEYRECFGKEPSSFRLSGGDEDSRQRRLEHLYSGKPAEITLIWHGAVEKYQQDIVNFLKKHKTMVVVDEAHRIKNAVGHWGRSAVEIAKDARARVILTGTPVPNGYEDLYNLYKFIYPYKFKDILGVHYSNLVDMTKNSSLESERVKSFTENISPFFIRIKKKDLNLPPVKNFQVFVEMDEAQSEIYDFIEAKYITSFQNNQSGTVRDVLNKAKLVRLRQAASNPALLLKSIKENLDLEDFEGQQSFAHNILQEFQNESEILFKISNYETNNIPNKYIKTKEIVKKILLEDEKVIIWTIFIQSAKNLQKFLHKHGIKAELLIGEVEQSLREGIIAKFNNPADRDFQVVIANPFAVSESISLHKGCHNAIYMERDYNCANFLQSRDRIHRVGLQDEITNYYYVISRQTIDEIIDRRLEDKVKRMEKIIDSEIPLFARLNDSDETDIIKEILEEYGRETF